MTRVSTTLAAIAAAVLAVPAAAATTVGQTGPLSAAGTTTERCADLRLDDAGRTGVASARFTPAVLGFGTAGVDAVSGDWDITFLDASTGARLGAAASSAGDEWTYVSASPGREIVALACRRPGASRAATATFTGHAVDLEAVERNVASLVEVDLGKRTIEALEATGLDVTHNHDDAGGHADVVLYGARDAAKLTRAGFTYETLIADLRAHDTAVLRADNERAASSKGSLLPSGRTTYRTLADYDADLKAIVDEHGDIARKVTIGRTLENRAIDGVELATDVNATDDGRPTFLVLGVHHAREWPSGEMPMEFALDIAKRFEAGDARVRALLSQLRIVAVPVVNRDGFEVSRTAGPIPGFDDNGIAPLPLSLADAGAYKRKNCRAAVAAAQAAPCITRPALQGVDPNRNYGAFFGGKGTSTNPAAQNNRGDGPYSEPETEAVHRLSSTRAITTLITHHTYTSEGEWLREPGFCVGSSCDIDIDVSEDEPAMAALGDAMAEASGWLSKLSWTLSQITGATEDWNYFTQGTYGYTPEQKGANFHPSYANAVIAQYDGTDAGANGGVAEALLRAAEVAAAPASHAIVGVTAPKGFTLRLSKSFATPTSLATPIQDRLDFVSAVPADGTLEWHVTQSSRPSCYELINCNVAPGTKEAYTLTCEDPTGAVRETESVIVDRGQKVSAVLTCGVSG